MKRVKLYTAEVVDGAIVTRKHLTECKSSSIVAAKRTAARRQSFLGTELLVVAVYVAGEEEVGSDIVARKRAGGKWE